MAFNLFDAEDRILQQAEALRSQLAEAPDDVRAGVEALIQGFRRSVREARRLVRVSDRLHDQLARANHELARRKAEAEEALARLQDTQESLFQAEKLASLGGLVAGVSHEINTPVGIILSCASHLADATVHLRSLFEADDIGVEDFERYLGTAAEASRLILSNSERAANLIRSFKQVAVDRTSAERRRFDLRATLDETLVSLVVPLRQAGHALEFDCPPGIIVDGYPGALSQIVTNLVMNALTHGYDAGQTGRLTLAARLMGDFLRLDFADDGKGIPAGQRTRIFDPFFTTRRGQGGTGLGLHIVYNLVTAALDGTITVDTEPGQGTRFIIVFPTAS